MWISVLWYSYVSSLQSLNEILASGSKDDSKAAVEKQVKRHFVCKDHQETLIYHPCEVLTSVQTCWCSSVQVQEVNAQLQRERDAEVQARQAARSADQASGGGGGGGGGKGWNEEDLQLLIKAVNLFPAGTNAR